MIRLCRHFLWVCLLAAGCDNGADLGGPCPNPDGGSGVEAGATGGAVGSGGAATSGGTSSGAGGVAHGGSAGNGASGNAGTTGSGGSASGDSGNGGTGGIDGGAGAGTGGADGGFAATGGFGGTTGGAGGTDADASSVASGGAGAGAAGARGDAGAPSYCADHRHDGDETDVDCGGSCPGCGPGLLCRTDADCGGVTAGCGDQCYCDTLTSTCVYNDCFDNKTDALETDFDCGGPLCKPCELGAKCELDTDCVSAACDAIKHECIAKQCQDHRVDGYESDVDCDGINCPSCVVGQKCHNSINCESGHVCNAQKVCQ